MGVSGPLRLSGEPCAPGTGPSSRRRATWAPRAGALRRPAPAPQPLRPRLRAHPVLRVGPAPLCPARFRPRRPSPSPAPSGSPRAAPHPTTGCPCCTAAAAAVCCPRSTGSAAVARAVAPGPAVPDTAAAVLITSKVVSLEFPRRLICWVDSLCTIRMTKERFFFLRLTADQKLEVRKNVVLQFVGGCGPAKVLRPLLHTHDPSLDLTLLSGRHGEPAGSPKNGTTAPRDRPARRLDPRHRHRPNSAQGQFGSVLSVSPVRRSLRRLRLPPQRPQRRATQSEPADVQRWQDPEFPELLRRTREWGALLACAERVRAPWGHARSDPRRAGGQRALPPAPAGVQQPGGPARGQGAGRPCHGGGLPGVP